MAEMREAAEVLQEVGWGVSVFGSARIRSDSPYYALAESVGRHLAAAGMAVIAGGGPGLMEAANKGAFEAGGTSVGLNIRLPFETKDNRYQTHSLNFDYFYSRKAPFFMHSAAYVALPGGLGTLDELFEVLTLLQTGKVPPAPVILMGTDFWAGLIDWMREQQLSRGLIRSADLYELMHLTHDLDEMMRLVNACCSQYARSPDTAPTLPE